MTAATLTAKAPAKAPKARKTRTRKTSPKSVKSAPLNNSKPAKVVMDELNNQVEAKSEVTPKVRPQSPKLSREDYLEDAKIRWEIHQYEIQELWKDLKVVGNWSVTHSKLAYNYCKDAYERAFN